MQTNTNNAPRQPPNPRPVFPFDVDLEHLFLRGTENGKWLTALLETARYDMRPRDLNERFLCDTIAHCIWRRLRLANMEQAIYERQGLISSWRNEGNQRRYGRHVLRRLAFIRASQRVGIPAAMLDQPAAELTVAGRKRLELARTLATEPKLLLLDEISEGLAPVIVQKLAETVLALRRQGYTIVMVEQNFRFAAPLADRFLVMEHGRIIQEFTQQELPQHMEQLHEYLGV